MRAWLEHEEPRPAPARRLARTAGRSLSGVFARGRARAAVRRARRPLVWLPLTPWRLSLAARRRRGAPWTSLRRGPPRHQRPDDGRRRRRHRARRVVRGRVGGVPVRARAAARIARDGAGARRHPRADGSGARRGARPARRHRTHASPIDAMRVGDIVIVRPGEKIPLDGRVSAGESHVNQAPMTGESRAGREGARRRGLRRHDQRPRRARRRGDAAARATRRWRASSTSSSARRRSARRARRSSTASRASTRRSCSCSRWRSPSCRRSLFGGAVERLDLSLARAAGDLVPVRARHLDAGLDRVGAGRGGAQGRAHQGRRAARASRRACAASRSTRPAR